MPQPHFSKEQTLVVIKPDGVQRSLIGEIIKRFERTGLKLVAIKMMVPTDSFIETHYTFDPEWKQKAGEKSIRGYEAKGLTPPTMNAIEAGDRILTSLKQYFSSGPVIAMVWQGAHAVAVVRKLVGSTEPFSSDVGTIRGDFVIDSYEMSGSDGRSIRNLIHASANVPEAQQEIPHWFAAQEIIDYRLVQESILYDVNIDGILE